MTALMWLCDSPTTDGGDDHAAAADDHPDVCNGDGDGDDSDYIDGGNRDDGNSGVNDADEVGNANEKR